MLFLIPQEGDKKEHETALGSKIYPVLWKKREKKGIFDRKMARLGFLDYKEWKTYLTFFIKKTQPRHFSVKNAFFFLFFQSTG